MKLLIGVDGSPGSIEALRQGCALVPPDSGQIVLYYSPPEVRLPNSSIDPGLLARSRQALADVVFDAAKAEMPPGLVDRVITITGTQPPKTGLLVAADECRADAIAVGARGVGPLERLLLGSVSHAVIMGTRIPVLVARPGGQAASDGDFRVLVACEGGDSDRNLVAAISSFHWPPHTQGQLMTVVEPMYAGQVPDWLEHKARSPESEEIAKAFEADFAAGKAVAAQTLRGLCRSLPPVFENCEPLVAEGCAAEQILAHAEKQQSQLIVVGAHAQGTVARFFIGSTALKVLAESRTSVLLIRHREQS